MSVDESNGEDRYSLKDASEVFGDFDENFEEGVQRPSRPGGSRPSRPSEPAPLSDGARISRELDRLGENVSIDELTKLLVAAKAQGQLLDAWDLMQGHLEQADRHDDCFEVLVALKQAGVDDLNAELLPVSQSEFSSEELRVYLDSDVPKAREAAELELLARGELGEHKGPTPKPAATSTSPYSTPGPVGSAPPPSELGGGFDWVPPAALFLTLGFALTALVFVWDMRSAEEPSQAANTAQPRAVANEQAAHAASTEAFERFGAQLEAGNCEAAWKSLADLSQTPGANRMLATDMKRRYLESCEATEPAPSAAVAAEPPAEPTQAEEASEEPLVGEVVDQPVAATREAVRPVVPPSIQEPAAEEPPGPGNEQLAAEEQDALLEDEAEEAPVADEVEEALADPEADEELPEEPSDEAAPEEELPEEPSDEAAPEEDVEGVPEEEPSDEAAPEEELPEEPSGEVAPEAESDDEAAPEGEPTPEAE